MKVTIENRDELLKKIDEAESLIKRLRDIFSWEIDIELKAEPSENSDSPKELK